MTEQADERWDLGDDTDATAAAQSVASWVGERLRAAEGRRGDIDLLCIDADGGACSWVSAPSADPRIVEAIVRQGSDTGDGADFAGSTSPGATLGTDVDVPGAATLQPLTGVKDSPAFDADEARRRLAVVAIPDAAVRVVIDELDRAGVAIGSVMSIWHAAAAAWDPSAETSRGMTRADDRVVAEDEPTTAVVLVDPAGRLVWAWSLGGELLTAGAMRLALHDDEVLIGADDVGRLAAEWLSWSAQLGRSPNRLAFVAPETLGVGSLEGPSLGAAVAGVWPGAALDLAVVPDPIGITIERAAQRTREDEEPNARTNLVALSNRRGRAHRGMYMWMAAALFAAAAVCGVLAVRAQRLSADVGEQAESLESERFEIVQQAVGTELASQPNWLLEIRRVLREERKALEAGKKRNELMPVMQELDTISWVIGYPEFELRDLSIGQLNANFTVVVPSIEQYEELRVSLDNIGGSRVNWTATAKEEQRGSDNIRVRCSGQWTDPEKDGNK